MIPACAVPGVIPGCSVAGIVPDCGTGPCEICPSPAASYSLTVSGLEWCCFSQQTFAAALRTGPGANDPIVDFNRTYVMPFLGSRSYTAGRFVRCAWTSAISTAWINLYSVGASCDRVSFSLVYWSAKLTLIAEYDVPGLMRLQSTLFVHAFDSPPTDEEQIGNSGAHWGFNGQDIGQFSRGQCPENAIPAQWSMYNYQPPCSSVPPGRSGAQPYRNAVGTVIPL